MPTNLRLQNTIDHLTTYARDNSGWLNLGDLAKLQQRIIDYDLTDGGNKLSLAWNRFDKNRPSEDLRKAIRAHIMMSLYNRDVHPDGIDALATKLKTTKDSVIYDEIKQKVTAFLQTPAIGSEACKYTLASLGGSGGRAKANCTPTKESIPQAMRRYASEGGLAVMLIDMQTNISVASTNSLVGKQGQKKYAGKTVLENMIEVLDTALECDLIVYEVIIDKDAAQGGNPKYGTITPLAEKMPKSPSKYRLIYKPFFNSFHDTKLAQKLKADKITDLVVMGHHANLCVLNTIFGTPGFMQDVGHRRMNSQEELVKMSTLGMNQELRRTMTDAEIQQTFTITEKEQVAYIPGLLERKINVFSARSILASEGGKLDPDWGILAGR
ncbi:isochorismatase family protein [Thalassomonas actiniarum]|uniref:Isochorismatase family protein n=1 Tax=Thalassomonas actiniarum TaxID=485447 RepID=A0AAE9YSJ0_9GAMM|nr:isochorismatase family protein [Thalassomonas actiniarum]WDD99927.1 isochorismatase family protein [Thalassomonas actiniarum]